jgi:hypothetical protein
VQLVATSTVGVAATGLAFGRPEPSTHLRPTSKKRKVGDLVDTNGVFPPSSRPATSSTVTTPDTRQFLPTLGSSPAVPSPFDAPPHSSNTRFDTFNNGRARRLSMVRNGDFSSLRNSMGEEPRRDSVSSRGSWIRRLSTIPISQSNSPRSSIGPDSPSLAMSLGSAAPILSNPLEGHPQLPPNKLVKRSTSGRITDGPIPRSGSKSQVPTLRRPATSHQRSITLQQRFREESTGPNDRIPETPPEQPIPFHPFNKFDPPASRTTWRPFFESRPTKLAKERPSGRSSDIGTQNFYSTSRRILPHESVKPTLVKPAMITESKTSSLPYFEEDSLPMEDGVDEEVDDIDEKYIPTTASHSAEPQKRPRRSLSMHFSSPGSWISRSGSLRGNKRGSDGKSGGQRYSSAPVATLPGRKITSSGNPGHNHRAITDPTVFQRQPLVESPPALQDSFGVMSFQARTRNTSSPLPPLSRLSSFNVDLARLGLSSSSSSQPLRSPNSQAPQSNTISTSVSSQGQMSPSSPSYYGSLNPKPHRMSEAVTLVGSEIETRGFTSGDEDDVDFQSETVFDSLRSGATGSVRSHNTPLDSMFDESPPSVNGSKSKRVSIHEMMANGTFQEGSKIVEEDEGVSTPIKASHSSQERDGSLETPGRKHVTDIDAFPSSSSFSLAAKDFGRLSLDDEEEDEDWTRDDENPDTQQLSPPSNQLTARRISPSLRAALADVTHTGSTNGNAPPSAERPKSNLFDWSEPSSAEKLDHLGNSPRPRTAHAKQVADGRGGRTIGRRGPTALHIRSQSVPVVPDVAGQRENSKLAPKFGTWGLGGKGVSEEWDGDFEFDDGGAANEDVDMESSLMLVPPAIQASQENVVGHVGQIREVCLLVEDLKRLRLLAREKDLLAGTSAHLWKEAEGIIALAVPDEEDPTLSPTQSPTSVVFSSEVVDEQFVEHGYDAEDIERPDAPLEVLNRHGRPTGFVYDGNTVRRRSVFSPDDEIFGRGTMLNSPATREYLRPPSSSPRPSSLKTSSEYARSVMQNMHQTRSTSDPLLGELTHQSLNKMPFDTTSLRDLVHRASVLRSKLSDLIRKSDGSFQIPEVSPKHESSPAFTRVFTDPVASPPKSPGRSHSNNSILSGSIDASPTRSLGQQHMHMMTVV